MKRVDAAGATVNNLFTTGNPSLSIPATTVDDTIMNAIQEEIAEVVEFAGLTLDQTNADLTQLRQAIQILIATGGLNQSSFTVANNVAAPANVTGMVFAKATVKAVRMFVDIFRRDDVDNFIETGELYVVHNTETDLWEISFSSKFDDTGLVFSVTAGGQVQYTSTDMAGGNYSGTMKWTVQRLNQ